MGAASLVEHRRALKIDVVSIQSQVVYGRVGNNAAVPMLETLGLSVVAVPTIVLSNIPSYPTVHGGAIPAEWFGGFLEDLRARDALRSLRAVQIGYLGDADQARRISDWVQGLLRDHPALKVVVDPAFGDQDHGVYGAAGIANAYGEHLLALGSVLTPNGYELGFLTGMPVGSIAEVVAAARSLLRGRTEMVVVTSAAPAVWSLSRMHLVVVTKGGYEVVSHPSVAASFAGTGDLFSAALTGLWVRGESLAKAIFMACAIVVRAVEHTDLSASRELLVPDGFPPVDLSRISTQTTHSAPEPAPTCC